MSTGGPRERALEPTDGERLIEALIELSAEHRHDEISVAMLAARAGLEERRVAQVFAAGEVVEECLLAAHLAVAGEVSVAASAAFSPDLSEWEMYIRVTKAYLEWVAANPSRAYFLYVACRNSTSERVRIAQDASRRALAALLDRMRQTSGFEGAPPLAALGAAGGVGLVVRRELAAGRAAQLPAALPELIYGTTAPLLGQEEAMRLRRRARALLAGTAWAGEENG